MLIKQENFQSSLDREISTSLFYILTIQNSSMLLHTQSTSCNCSWFLAVSSCRTDIKSLPG